MTLPMKELLDGQDTVEFIHFGGGFVVSFLHIAAVKCNQSWTCDGIRHQEEDAKTLDSCLLQETMVSSTNW